MTTKQKVPYRLGLDLGANSIGWAAVRLDEDRRPSGILDMGVRVFPDGRHPTSEASNAATRRTARGVRRQHQRHRVRRNRFMRLLIRHGLMPREEATRKGLQRRNPYKLRAKALKARLPVDHVGRALFHLNERRGFQSNRKTEQTKQSASETGVIKEASKRLREQMGSQTLGEFLYCRHRAGKTTRSRNTEISGRRATYDFYPTREIILDEFDKIWAKQAQYHPAAMTDDAQQALRATIADQRPLAPQPVGKCTLDPARTNEDIEGFRCPWAYPLAQRFRILQEVRNLEVQETGRKACPLSKEDGDKVIQALIKQATVSFNRIRKMLNLPSDATFNLEGPKRIKLLGDQTAAKLGHKDMFGRKWRGLSLDQQIEIVEHLLDESKNDDSIAEWLTQHTAVEIDRAAAQRVVAALLPNGHCRLGLRAIRKLLPRMKSGMNYSDAARSEGYDHSQTPTGELALDGRLPYYGEWLQRHLAGTGDPRHSKEQRWGRYPNPTVHIGLGQLRRVVNSLISEYGRPSQVVIEMTRDFKLSPRRVTELENDQRKNQDKNDQRKLKLKDLGLDPEDYENRLKLRLWEELNPKNALDRRCPFTGEVICLRRLFFSGEVEFEHLIPWQDSWDDSPSNKVVSLTSANRLKGKRTPHEAFGETPEWESIIRRADKLPKSKRWRFAENARAQFNEQGGFLARQLHETGWLARLAKQYLSAIASPNNIWVTPGRLTSMIRAKWSLNDLLPGKYIWNVKKRTDHRHHAIDALVVALTDRSLLLRMSNAYDEQRSRIKVPQPWETLRGDLKIHLNKITVSHKPDHGVQHRLHEDTSYGTVSQPDLEGDRNLVYRKAFSDLTEAEAGRIRDVRLRGLVQAHIEDAKAEGQGLKAALLSFSKRQDIPGLSKGIRHVRLLKTENSDSLIRIAGRNRTAYISDENAFVDILETPAGKWVGESVSKFKANQKDYRSPWINTASPVRFVMRVFKGDLLALPDNDGNRTIMRVHHLDASANRFKLAPHNEAGKLQKRHDDPADPFRWRMWRYNVLKSRNAERVRVDPLGRVWRVNPEEAERALRARSGPRGRLAS